jgi:HEAT repeat protein
MVYLRWWLGKIALWVHQVLLHHHRHSLIYTNTLTYFDLPHVISTLHSNYYRNINTQALISLGQRYTNVIDVLVELVKSDDHNRQKYASSMLIRIGEGSVQRAASLLRNPDPEVRKIMLESVGWYYPAGNDRRHHATLPNKSRIFFLRECGIIILELIKDPVTRVRRRAIRAVCSLNYPDAIPALRAAEHDSDWTIRREATEAIQYLEDVKNSWKP